MNLLVLLSKYNLLMFSIRWEQLGIVARVQLMCGNVCSVTRPVPYDCSIESHYFDVRMLYQEFEKKKGASLL